MITHNHNLSLSGAACIMDLDSIDAVFAENVRRNDQVVKSRRQLRNITILSSVVVFFIGVFAYLVYDHVMGQLESERIARLAQERVAASHLNQQSSPQLPVEDLSFTGQEAEPVPRPILSKIQNLREEFNNDDIVGFIRVDGTEIHYMVMQSADNEYYLDKNVYHQVTDAGSVFMDFENSPGDLNANRNTILYGHNMRNGTMFHNLRLYQEKQFFETNKYVNLTTLHDETTWEIFAFYTTHIEFEYIQVYFPDDASFVNLVDEMKEKSFHESEVSVGPEDVVLTLSTCQGGTDRNMRHVVNAKLISSAAVEDLEPWNTVEY